MNPILEERLDRLTPSPEQIVESLENLLPDCDGVVWLAAYAVQRCYGGPEEGGWYWNAYEMQADAPFPLTADTLRKVAEDISETIETWKKTGLFENEGDIYSVNGGVEYHYCIENMRGESETKTAPRYC